MRAHAGLSKPTFFVIVTLSSDARRVKILYIMFIHVVRMFIFITIVFMYIDSVVVRLFIFLYLFRFRPLNVALIAEESQDLSCPCLSQ